MKNLYHIICIFSVFYNNFLNVYCYYCHLPDKCRKQMISDSYSLFYNENLFQALPAIMCEIDDDSYELTINSAKPLIAECEKVDNFTGFSVTYVDFRWTNTKQTRILDKRWNFSNMYSYFANFINSDILRFFGLNGFDINMLEGIDLENKTLPYYMKIKLYNCRMEFYYNNNRINSCEDVKNANLTKIESIFQIAKVFFYFLNNVEYKQEICPLLFSNVFLYYFWIVNIVDTFYKKNVIRFSNETFDDLNSKIFIVNLASVHSINLDLSIFHPSVFKNTTSINIDSDSLNSIDAEIFRHLKRLHILYIWSAILRKINHKQGIEWIRNMNYGLNVNLSNLTGRPFEINLQHPANNQGKRLTKIFPNEDFCIYLDFPFNQFVIIKEDPDIHYIWNNETKLTCTFLWLIQYYESYHKYYLTLDRELYSENLYSLEICLNSKSFKRISQCDFKKRIHLCNKSNYQIKDVWDENDFFILNKKIQIAFKSSL